jgi:hypothetical protein
MNCAEFWENLESYREGLMTPEERHVVEKHLNSCAACRNLLQTASDLLDLQLHPIPPDLTRSILERTSGPACGRAREHLCDFVDGVLDARYAKILSLHLENCADCSALAAVLADLKECLPQMGEIEPGPSFTVRVLGETSLKPPESHVNPWAPIQKWWQLLIQRPRFSWEAAYLGTVFLVCVLGNPLTTIRDLSVRAAEVCRSEQEFSIVSVALPGSLIRSETGIVRNTREFADSVSVRQNEVVNSIAGFIGRRARSFEASLESDFQWWRSLAPKAASALHRTWLALFPRSK